MHKPRIIFATGNAGKLREIREIMPEYELVTMREAGFSDEIVEDGDSFEANARIKARAVWEVTGGIVMADDSGLIIDCLDGEPGIYSARYMEDFSYEEKNANLIQRVNAAGRDRNARFTAAIVCILPDGQELITTASMEGEIADSPRGSNGFGYDPILFLKEYQKTGAELDAEEKNRISHRGKALRAMKEKLQKIINIP